MYAWSPKTPGEVPASVYPRDEAGEVRFAPLAGEGKWPPCAEWTWGHWAWWLKQQGWTSGQCEWYRQARDQYGVSVTREGKTRWVYRPTPRQIALHSHPAKYVLFGGAVGGTKSHGLRWDFYLRGLRVGGYRGLMLRRTMPELIDNHIEKVPADMAALGLLGVKVDSEGYLRLPPPKGSKVGAVLRFGHCKDVGDERKYLGPEYDWFCPDEGVTFVPKQVTGVMGRLRSTIPGVRPVMRAGTNPGGFDPQWWVSHFITKAVDRTVEKRYRPEWYAYIPAFLFDNPYLMESDGTYTEYISTLDVQDPIRVRQLLEGDWAVHEGQYFREWNPSVHVAELHVPPTSATWLRAVDWGYAKPGVCLWAAVLPDGRLYVRHEYVFRETVASEAAAEIRQRTTQWGLRVTQSPADPAMWIREGQTGESHAETWARAGVVLLKAKHERVNGWGRLRAWLRPAPDGKPWLIVHPDCQYLIRTLPTLSYDTTRPEDLDTDGEDHAADALRYLVMSRPAPQVPGSGRPKPPEHSLAWYAQRAQGKKRPLTRRRVA